MAIILITDSSNDLPKTMLQEQDIRVVPLKVYFGDEEYIDQVTISNQEFYSKMHNFPVLPRTASPAPHHFMEEFLKTNNDDQIILITVSDKLSSTYEHACLARTMFQEERPNQQIEIIDSKTASVGLGNIVLRVAEKRNEGVSFAELVAYAREQAEKIRTYFVLDTLENVIKGGRLDKIKGRLAEFLSIKLIMFADEGKIELHEKVRTSKRAISKLINLIGELTQDKYQFLVGVAHSNCKEKGEEIKHTIEELYQDRKLKVFLTEMGATIGTYAGEGGIVISFS
ncbi:DegV family protein [Rubeoparvulum massiliense]|uniref:DegV family protein n=1 Tax=Rubeoparvulum massiliense TaxID=1631346 RepID=UPI00065E5C4F|nr:DegV family protein [Rubeoparvulum massiliense]